MTMVLIDLEVLSTAIAVVATLGFIGQLILIISGIRKYEKSSSSSFLHYPPYAPGTMLHHIRMTSSPRYPFWILDVANNQLNTNIFQLSLPLRPLSYKFVVGDAQTAREILMDEHTTKPIDIYGHMRNLNYRCKSTMFTLNGSEWYTKRKAAAHAFASKYVKRMTNMAIANTDDWIASATTAATTNDAKANDSSKDGRSKDSGAFEFDVSKTMLDIVLSAITETAFEYTMSPKEKEIFGHELELALIEFAVKAPTQPHRVLFGKLIRDRRRAVTATKNIRELMLHIMNEYNAKKERGESSNGSLIQLIMDANSEFPNEDEKIAQLLELLVAGHDTTAFSVSWILLSLARNVTEQTKLRNALKELSPDEWRSCTQLKHVVKEGMRLYPVASAGSIRVTGRDFTTHRNELLPMGSICFIPFLLLFRNKDIFTDPDEFIPSRWEDPSREMLDAYNPFSLGKQNCVGQSLAQAETYAIVARIVSEFELTVKDEGSIDFFLTLKPVGAILQARKI